jgi:hypothetical protein
MKIRALPLTKLALNLLLASSLNGAPNIAFVEWDIASATNLAPVKSYEAEILTASNISANGVTPLNLPATYPGSFCATDWSSYASAPDTAKYYGFSVTANQGKNFSLTGITMALEFSDYGGGIGAQHWELYVDSAPSGEYSGTLVASYDLSSYDLNHQVFIDGSGDEVDDSGLISAIDGAFVTPMTIVGGETYAFRLVGYYTSSNSSDYSGLSNMQAGTYGGDTITGTGSNVILYGTIPEPSSYVLILSLALCMHQAARRHSGLF